MEKIDIRKLSDKERSLLRKQVIGLRKQGIGNNEIAERLGLSRETTSRWWKRYQREGKAMLSVPRRGRKHGEKRRLSHEQEKQIQKMIVDHYPEQLKLPFALWDRQAVTLLILQQFGINLPVRTVGDYLSRWGYTPQRPIRKAYEQRPAEVERWMQESYPAIREKAKAEKAEIYWGDETGISTNGNLVRGYAPAGKTPELRINARKEHISMISAISNKGKLRFMLYEDAMNGKRLIEFMKRLVKDVGHKVILILDNLKVHHCKPVKKWLGENTDKIEVFYLPAYSPELNPDEYLNNDLKQTVHGNYGGVAKSKAAIHQKTISHMRHLQKSPQKVEKLFDHPHVRYAKN
ncbi:MAG TPA: IS630 family transposase [Chlorobaculum parvum]|uniref:IS630 family transposase n=1 Tax=Chlorobaculum parvum TaxID=274539 RepID=A0A7C5DFG0_9CHLB|nr:IS630 family transposase [Chlorobaculum parvum]